MITIVKKSNGNFVVRPNDKIHVEIFGDEAREELHRAETFEVRVQAVGNRTHMFLCNNITIVQRH